MKPQREQSFVSQILCAFACVVALGWGKVPFSHRENPSQSVLTLRRKLHSSQLDLARSRRRSGGQEVSDMKRSEIVISPEGGLVFEPPVVVFKPEEGACNAPSGALGSPTWAREVMQGNSEGSGFKEDPRTQDSGEGSGVKVEV
jgi:hypothetical protein